MSDLRHAAQQALEALKAHGAHAPNCDHLILLTSLPPQRKPCSCGLVSAITALKQALAAALAEPEQRVWCACGDSIQPDSGAKCGNCVAGDSAEPEQPVALSDERIDFIADTVVKGMPEGISGFCKSWGWRQFARAILQDCAGHYAPAPRKPLTDEEIALISGECAASAYRHDDLSFARSIIAAYERKNGIGEQT